MYKLVLTGKSIKWHTSSPFTLLVSMPQTVSFRVMSARLHSNGQSLYGCLYITQCIMEKKMKRKMNSQLKFRLIVKMNDKYNK